MKEWLLLLSFLFSVSLFSQQLYWYDVILEVNGEDTVQFEEAVDSYYSSVDFPADVTMIPVFVLLKKMPEFLNWLFSPVNKWWSSDLYFLRL